MERIDADERGDKLRRFRLGRERETLNDSDLTISKGSMNESRFMARGFLTVSDVPESDEACNICTCASEILFGVKSEYELMQTITARPRDCQFHVISFKSLFKLSACCSASLCCPVDSAIEPFLSEDVCKGTPTSTVSSSLDIRRRG